MALARLLLETGPRHVTAEELFQEARSAGIPVSLATVYNTLHQFTAAGLMTEVVAGSGQSYFDTNPTSHYHYFDKTTGEIIDVPEDAIQFTLPARAAAGQGDRPDRRRGAHPQREPSRLGYSPGATPQIADLGSQPSSSADLDPAPVALAAISTRRSRRARRGPRRGRRRRPSGAAPGCPAPTTITVRWIDSRLEWAQPVSPSGSSIRRQSSNSSTIRTGRPVRV